jgi:hypothetical protein
MSRPTAARELLELALVLFFMIVPLAVAALRKKGLGVRQRPGARQNILVSGQQYPDALSRPSDKCWHLRFRALEQP